MKKVFKHSFSGGGHSARRSQACGDLGQGGATLSLKDGAIKITEPPNMLVLFITLKRLHATRPGKRWAVGVSGRNGSLVTQALSQLVVEVGIFLTRPHRTLAHPGPRALKNLPYQKTLELKFD